MPQWYICCLISSFKKGGEIQTGLNCEYDGLSEVILSLSHSSVNVRFLKRVTTYLIAVTKIVKASASALQIYSMYFLHFLHVSHFPYCNLTVLFTFNCCSKYSGINVKLIYSFFTVTSTLDCIWQILVKCKFHMSPVSTVISLYIFAVQRRTL